jgi:hypothetical protein
MPGNWNSRATKHRFCSAACAPPDSGGIAVSGQEVEQQRVHLVRCLKLHPVTRAVETLVSPRACHALGGVSHLATPPQPLPPSRAGACLLTGFTASNCTSSRGTSDPGEQPSTRDTTGRDCCGAGSRSDTSGGTCTCTASCRKISRPAADPAGHARTAPCAQRNAAASVPAGTVQIYARP